MKQCYASKKFSDETIQVIGQANDIIEEYAAQGFDLTLRQLFYQFVSRGLISNKDKSYKRLGSIINDARMAGLVDWATIKDRTRTLRTLAHWGSPKEIIEACASQYRVDKWERQPNYVEVWIEKDALIGVIEGVCEELDVPYFACRGYVSQSFMYEAGMRISDRADDGKEAFILHLGDHDPSGIDMTRDIEDRLRTFHYGDSLVSVRRLALNMDQVDEHEPPPNPAKLTDSRAHEYIGNYGYESWELDALPPNVIYGLVRDEVELLRDEDTWDEDVQRELDGRERIGEMAEQV